MVFDSDTDTEYDEDNIMYTLNRRPYCAEKYNEINIGPYEAEKSNKNTPCRAPLHSSSYFHLIEKDNNYYTIKYKSNDNYNNDLYEKYIDYILFTGLFAITLGVCISIDILYNNYIVY
jgi:hypothetical protein